MQKKPVWPRIRKFFNDVHLWLGLSSGLIVVAVCFSGTIYVWNTELVEWSAPQLYKAKQPEGTRMVVDSLVQKVKDASQASITAITISSDKRRNYQFTTRKDGDNGRGSIIYFVDPYNGNIAGTSAEKSRTREFMSTMFSLHRWLCLYKIGRRNLGSAITGWATIIFTLGCFTGLIIWFPRKVKAWKQGLKIRMTGNWKRTNHDLHNTLAFYSLFFLLLMGITGPQFSFTWYRNGLQKTLGTYKSKEVPVAVGIERRNEFRADTLERPAAAMPSINSYILVAQQAFGYEGDYVINLSSGNSTTVNISRYKRGFFAPAAPDRLTLDAATAIVKKKDIFRDKPFNERVAGSIKAIHVGNVYGIFSKILYFFACLVATSLPVTGTLIWLNKLKKTKKRTKRLSVLR